MTPNPDSVAVLRERIENVARDVDPNDGYDSGMNFKQIASELRAIAAALHPAPPGSAVDELTCRTLLANFARDWNVLPPAECAEILARSMKAALAARTGKGDGNV